MRPSIAAVLFCGLAAIAAISVVARREFRAARAAESETATLMRQAHAITLEMQRLAAQNMKLPGPANAGRGPAAPSRPATDPAVVTTFAAASPSSPAPARRPVEPIAQMVRKDPLLQALQIAADRARAALQFEPLFRTLRLTPEQIEQFQMNLVRREEQKADLDAAVQAQGMDDEDMAVMRLRGRLLAEYEAAQRGLLGEAGFREWYRYEQTLPLREAVRGIAVAALAAGVPLTPQQAEELTQTIIRSTNFPRPEMFALSKRVDWAAVDAQTRSVLSDAQFALFQSIDPHLQVGDGLRFRGRLNVTIDGARAADAAQPPSSTTKAPGS